MKTDNRLVAGLILAVAGTMLWANLSWAQGRGGGRGPGCPLNNQTSQITGQGRGQGQGNVNCPNYPGYGNRGQGRGANAQNFAERGPRGRGMNPQANNPNVNQ